MFSLNTCTAAAMLPISSPRPIPGTVAAMSPSARLRIVTVIRPIGREMPCINDHPATRRSAAIAPTEIIIQVWADCPKAAPRSPALLPSLTWKSRSALSA